MVLAHMGGIDEIAVAVIPIVVVLLLLKVLRNREAARSDGDEGVEPPGSVGDGFGDAGSGGTGERR